MSEIQNILDEILTDNSPPKDFKICHIRDMDNFFRNPRGKQIPCRFFLNNNCHKGKDCQYSHVKDNQKTQKFKTEICKNFEQGNCKYGQHCNFAHGAVELRRT